MATGSLDYGSYKNLSVTANVQAQDGLLLGFFLNSTSSGTIQFYDSATTTTTTTISGSITPTTIGFYPFPVNFQSGLYVVLGGTINVTIIYAGL